MNSVCKNQLKPMGSPPIVGLIKTSKAIWVSDLTNTLQLLNNAAFGGQVFYAVKRLQWEVIFSEFVNSHFPLASPADSKVQAKEFGICKVLDLFRENWCRLGDSNT